MLICIASNLRMAVRSDGAMEFFTSPERLLDLKNRMAGFPEAYQLVVCCTAENSLPLSCGYAAHYVLKLL